MSIWDKENLVNLALQRLREMDLMSVGGRVLEIINYTLRDDDGKVIPRPCVRIWVIDTYYGHKETVVYAEPAAHMPRLGDEVWWQGSTIYFNNDRSKLKKIGYSHSAPVV